MTRIIKFLVKSICLIPRMIHQSLFLCGCIFLIVVIFIFTKPSSIPFKRMPQIDDLAAFTPHYTSYPQPDEEAFDGQARYTNLLHAQTRPRLWQTIDLLGLATGLSSRAFGHPLTLPPLIKKLLQERKAAHYTGDFIQALSIQKAMQVIVFADIAGDVHALIESLKALVHQGVLSPDLSFTHESFNMVFIGNSIGYSPYNLATLNLIWHLMCHNPERVFYLQGKHEQSFDINSYGIEEEIKIRSYGFAEEPPLQGNAVKRLISSFFKTLPQALYLQIPHSGIIDLVCLASTGSTLEKREGDTSYFPFLLTMKNETVLRTHHLGKPTPFVALPLAIKAVIQGGAGNGTKRLKIKVADDASATSWALRSSLSSYDGSNKRKDISFLMLNLDPPNDSLLVAEYRIENVFKKEAFSSYEYELITGKQLFLEQALPLEEEHEEESFDEEWDLSPDDVALSDIRIEGFLDEDEKIETLELD